MVLASYIFPGVFGIRSSSVESERRVRIVFVGRNSREISSRVILCPVASEIWHFRFTGRIRPGVLSICFLFECKNSSGKWRPVSSQMYPVSLWPPERVPWIRRGIFRRVKIVNYLLFFRIPMKAAHYFPSIVEVFVNPAFRRFQKLCRERMPRDVWENSLSKSERVRVWSKIKLRRNCLGTFHQNSPRNVLFDDLPGIKTSRSLPRLTVVTPSFNQAEFLSATMDSVLSHGDIPLDYIVMDGGSTDGSASVIKERQSYLKHWQSGPDKGQSSAIRNGFKHMECGPDDVMAYLNSDDLYCPGTLEYVLRFFAENPDVDVVYGHRIAIDKAGKEIGRWVLPPHDPEVFKLVDYVPQETLFWRRRVYDEVGGIDSSFQFAMDWDLLLKMQKKGARIVRLPWFLAMFRIHQAQKTQQNIDDIGSAEMKRLRIRENHNSPPLPDQIWEAVRKSQVESAWYSDQWKDGKRI